MQDGSAAGWYAARCSNPRGGIAGSGSGGSREETTTPARQHAGEDYRPRAVAGSAVITIIVDYRQRLLQSAGREQGYSGRQSDFGTFRSGRSDCTTGETQGTSHTATARWLARG